MDNEVEITELYDLEVERHDGVEKPASGFSFLVTKAMKTSPGCECCEDCPGPACKCDTCSMGDCGQEVATKDVNSVGGINEKPDIAGADQVLCLLYKLVEAEAREGAIGADEACDINLLSEAISLIKWFRENEQMGDEDDGAELAKSEIDWFCKAHRKFSSADRKSLAAAGHALPDGSYPIPDEDALRRAAILTRSGHGDVAAAKKLIARRAKELGVKNPLDESTQKDAPEATSETSEVEDATKSETPAPLTAEAAQELIKAALAERDSEAEKRIEALKSELDVLKATPIPGGPVISATTEQRAVKAKTEAIAKAAHWRRQAELTSDREMIAEYTRRANAAEAEAN